ncbi:MAG: DnaJ domain-containing protein [Methylococcaceae bacterium]|nr:DnaJ domain-containing protein [Methylococcaceae bacterium]
MQTPFEILDVAEDASDEAIKKAYLKKVRENPPERNVAAFQQIREAYERIRTEKQRREFWLFHHEKPDFQALLRRSLHAGVPERPDVGSLTGALTESVLDDLKAKTPH